MSKFRRCFPLALHTTGVSIFGPLAEGQHRPTLIKNFGGGGVVHSQGGMCPQNKGRGKVANSYQPAAGWDPKRWWTLSKRGWGKGSTHTFGQAPRMGELMGRWGKATVHSLNLSPQKISLGHPQPPQARRKRAKKPISLNPTIVRLRPEYDTGNPGDRAISIPLWCDCDRSGLPAATRAQRVSIPLWCDCDPFGAARWGASRRVSIPLWCDCDLADAEISLLGGEFQSHYGAIATFLCSSHSSTSHLFQSHYGAIATAGGTHPHHGLHRFQSHYGAIATEVTHNLM